MSQLNWSYLAGSERNVHRAVSVVDDSWLHVFTRRRRYLRCNSRTTTTIANSLPLFIPVICFLGWGIALIPLKTYNKFDTDPQSKRNKQCLFRTSLGAGIPTPRKNCQFPPPIACSKSLFSAGKVNYRYITETFFHWAIQKNYSSLNNRKGANFCQKCTKICLAAVLHPDSLGSLCMYLCMQISAVRAQAAAN